MNAEQPKLYTDATETSSMGRSTKYNRYTVQVFNKCSNDDKEKAYSNTKITN